MVPPQAFREYLFSRKTAKFAKLAKINPLKVILITSRHSHATIEKKKIVHWSGNAELRTIVPTSGHPNKVYLGTVEGDFKKDIITISDLSKIRRK